MGPAAGSGWLCPSGVAFLRGAHRSAVSAEVSAAALCLHTNTVPEEAVWLLSLGMAAEAPARCSVFICSCCNSHRITESLLDRLAVDGRLGSMSFCAV